MKLLMLGSGSIHSSLTHRILSLGRELVRHGHDVTIIVPAADKYNQFQAQKPSMVDGVKVIYPFQLPIKNAFINLIPYIFSAAWMVLRQRADVVYIYKPTPISIPGLFSKWLKGTPVVLDLDDLGSEVMAAEGQPAPVWRLVAWCERLAATQAKAIIVASSLLEREQSTLYPRKPILLLSNGVDPQNFVPQRPNRPAQVIFFGAMNRSQLVAPLLKSVAYLKDHQLDQNLHVEILGDGSARPELETLADKLNIRGIVNFRGWTQLSDLTKYAAAGDIGICIMPQERTTAACSNQKVFQYMALGLCPVVSTVGDLPLYIENGAAGSIVQPEDTEGLAKTLHELLHNDKRRAALAERGRKLAETKYAWQVLATKLETTLEEIR